MSAARVRTLLWARGLRAFADGFVSLLLPIYLIGLGLIAIGVYLGCVLYVGWDGGPVGVIATATLLGSGALTLLVGWRANRFDSRALLLAAAVLMCATGLGFATVTSFWPLVVIAVVGTVNPSTGDLGVLVPLEHAVLARVAADKERTATFARYSLVGALAGALGAIFAGVPELLAAALKLDVRAFYPWMFVLYAGLGLTSGLIYRKLPVAAVHTDARAAPLKESKRIVYTLAALFSLDAFGGGFIVQSLLALWLFEKFQLSTAVAGTIFFWTGVLSAFSYLVAARIAHRIGQHAERRHQDGHGSSFRQQDFCINGRLHVRASQ